MSSWDSSEKGWATLRDEKPVSYRPGLSDLHLRIMGALEACHNAHQPCTPANVLAHYIDRNGGREQQEVWDKAAQELCAMSTIWRVNTDGTWALTAWDTAVNARPQARRGTVAGRTVLGESGGENTGARRKRRGKA